MQRHCQIGRQGDIEGVTNYRANIILPLVHRDRPNGEAKYTIGMNRCRPHCILNTTCELQHVILRSPATKYITAARSAEKHLKNQILWSLRPSDDHTG